MNSESAFICITCGTQFAPAASVPPLCPICCDERQYVGHGGQQWATLEEMRGGEWKNAIREQESRLIGIGTEPKFGIGQRALLVQYPGGNVLWDCVSLLDDSTVKSVRDLGGVHAMAISHPHYYSAMVEWSRAFGGVPIYLHERDREWVQRPDAAIQLWDGDAKVIGDGLTLIHTGGHFDGFQVLHWRDGAEGRGVLLSGDQPQVCSDPRWVSFMWSYPNYVPLSAGEVRRIAGILEPWTFDRIYGAFWPSIVPSNGKGVMRRSVDRYLRRLEAP